MNHLMTARSYELIETVLFDYACSKLTARQVQAQLAKWGYKADLVHNQDSNVVDVLHINSGSWHKVEI